MTDENYESDFPDSEKDDGPDKVPVLQVNHTG